MTLDEIGENFPLKTLVSSSFYTADNNVYIDKPHRPFLSYNYKNKYSKEQYALKTDGRTDKSVNVNF